MSDLNRHTFRLELADGGIHGWSKGAVNLASKTLVVRPLRAEVSSPGWSRVIIVVDRLDDARASWLLRHLTQLVDVVHAEHEPG